MVIPFKLIGADDSLQNTASASFNSSNNLPVVSLTSSSSTSSSCTQLADSSSNHSTETGDDLDIIIPKHVASKAGEILPNILYKRESLLNIGIEMNASKKDDKTYNNIVSDSVTEPLLAIKYNDAKILNGTDNLTGVLPGLTNGNRERTISQVRNVAVKTPSSSAMTFLENGRKISDINKNMHKTSVIDYKTEARKLDQTRSNWSDSNVRKTSKQNERRQSISSEESLSDYEELGVNHSAIHGDIPSHRSSR